MSEAVEKNYTETVYAPKVIQFTLANRQPSGYRMEGDDKPIDYPKYKNILTRDRCVLSKEIVDYYNTLVGEKHLRVDDEGVVWTRNKVSLGAVGDIAWKRYIKSATTIWEAEQDKQGFKPGKDGADEIWMIKGEVYVDVKNNPADKGLWLHLLMHNQNEDFPLKDSSIAEPIFKVLDEQRNASNEIEKEDLVQEARNIVFELRDRKTKRFNQDKMNFYTNVFRKQIGGMSSDEQKFNALLKMADTKPELIVNQIQSETVDYISTVHAAIDLGILVRERGKFLNTYTENTVITFRAGVPDHEVMDKLVNFYASKAGENEYEHLKKSVEAVKASRIS